MQDGHSVGLNSQKKNSGRYKGRVKVRLKEKWGKSTKIMSVHQQERRCKRVNYRHRTVVDKLTRNKQNQGKG